MKVKAKPRISQCMIVKNEEKNMKRALSWGKGIVEEQIVVDTGSTDRTVELARAMGAKVFSFEWIDDFSAAKNFAISKASGDWIAFLDADEYFLPEEARRMTELVAQLDKTPSYALLTSWLQVREDGSIYAGGNQIRIFRHLPGLRYRNRIHEELYLEGAEVFRVVDATKELAIYHTGYAGGEELDRQKGERNAKLLLKSLEEEPDNYHLMGYLGDAYYSLDDGWEKAKDWYYRAIDKMPPSLKDGSDRSATTFWKLMYMLSQEKKEEELLRIYQKATGLLPEESDFDYIVGSFYAEKEEFQKAAFYLQRSLSLLETYGSAKKGMLVTGNLPETYHLLASCHYQTGNLSECVKCCTLLLKANPYLMSTLVLLLVTFKKTETGTGEVAGQVAQLLGKFYNLSETKARFFILRAARDAGYSQLENIIRSLCSQAELEAFDAPTP